MWRVDSKKGAWKQGHYWNSASVVQEEIMWLGLDGPCVDGSKWSDWRYSLMAQTGLVRCEVWGKGRKQRCLLGFGLEPWEEQNCHLLKGGRGRKPSFRLDVGGLRCSFNIFQRWVTGSWTDELELGGEGQAGRHKPRREPHLMVSEAMGLDQITRVANVHLPLNPGPCNV